MAQRREGVDMVEQLADELKVQAWLAGAELRHPSLREVSLRNEVDALARVRDELRVQLHLGGLEAKDEFQRLEGRWRDLMQAAAQTAGSVAVTIRDIVREIREGYLGIAHGKTGKEPA